MFNLQLDVMHSQGNIAKTQGEYYQAERVFKEALDLIEQLGITTVQIGLTYFHLGSLYYQWNELDTAEMYFKQSAAWGERTGIADIVLNTNSKALVANFSLRLGKLVDAVRWANASGFTSKDQPNFSRFGEYLIYVDIRLAESRVLNEPGEITEFIHFLDWFIQHAQLASHVFLLSEVLFIRHWPLILVEKQKTVYRFYEEKLVISNNTVRSHIKNIYGKLGVNNRTQAVLIARELKFI